MEPETHSVAERTVAWVSAPEFADSVNEFLDLAVACCVYVFLRWPFALSGLFGYDGFFNLRRAGPA